VIGDSSYPGQERPVAIGYDEASVHSFVLGANSPGKTTLLGQIAEQVANAGCGMVLMEAAGDLIEYVLNYMPAKRVNDVIYLNLGDDRWPAAFNVMDQGHPPVVIREITNLFRHIFGGDGIWAREFLKQGLRIIAEVPCLTFIDIVWLLNPMTDEEIKWADGIARKIKDTELSRWYERYENKDIREQRKRTDPVMSRLYGLAAPELRYILGQSKSTFQLIDVLLENKILLVNLKGMNVDKDSAALIGTLIMQMLWHNAMHIQNKTVPTFLILDEFHQFMDLPIDTETMLAQARKHKLPMVLATQGLKQLKQSVEDAVITNARNKIIFAGNERDGNLLAKNMANEFTGSDITRLEKYHAIASILTPTGPSGR
jgi:TraM recognition site of TraD and TraG